jgi:leucyl/phenylalanyl-tRNA--protein transferase
MSSTADDFYFPHPSLANSEGLVAIGGDLNAKRVLEAYKQGIFPWYEENQPILWWSPDPRMVLFLDKFKVSKSLRKTINSDIFKVTFNTHFLEVITQCASVKRNGQKGTWITDSMIATYHKLHQMGYAKSIEVWQHEKLVGGLYGIALENNKIFCGESMFSLVSDASKVALYFLVEKLKQENYFFIDCQVYTNHLASLGAAEIPRIKFLSYL